MCAHIDKHSINTEDMKVMFMHSSHSLAFLAAKPATSNHHHQTSQLAMDAFLLSVMQNEDTLHAKDTTLQQYLLY